MQKIKSLTQREGPENSAKLECFKVFFYSRRNTIHFSNAVLVHGDSVLLAYLGPCMGPFSSFVSGIPHPLF